MVEQEMTPFVDERGRIGLMAGRGRTNSSEAQVTTFWPVALVTTISFEAARVPTNI
jgi:hypothetical protein